MDASRRRGHASIVGRRESARQFEVPERSSRSMPPPSSILHRTADPSVLRSIAEIDERLVVQWDPEGIWWTPASRVPPGVQERGGWWLALRGDSGALRGIRMWPPDCADGRLVDYLRATWGQWIFALRSTSSPDHVRRQRLDNVKATRKALEQQLFDAWWDKIDHGEMHRAVRADLFDPKWRGNWQVHAETPLESAAPQHGV